MPRGTKRGRFCREGCATKEHRSYAECLRGAGIRVAYANSANGWDKTREDKWVAENDRYSSMIKAGIEPEGVTHAQMDKTERKLEKAQAIAGAMTKGDFDVS